MINSDLIVSIFCFLFGAVIYYVTRDLSHLGGVFINYLLVVIGFLSVIVFIKGIVKPEKIKFFRDMAERNSVGVGIVILAIYLAFMPFAGFLPSSYVFYAVFNLYLGEEPLSKKNIIQSTLLSVVVVTLFYLIFYHLLQVPLPEGSWWLEE